MEKKIIISMISFMVLSSVCANSYAFDGQKDRYGQGEPSIRFFNKFCRILKAEKQLNLSDDQVKKIEKEIIRAKKEVIRANAEIKIISLDMKMSLKQDKINIKSINKLIDQKYEFKKNKMKILVDAYAKIKNILTKEQKEILPEIFKRQKEEYVCINKKHRGSRCPYEYQGREFCPAR